MGLFSSFMRAPSINEDNIVEQWSQLLLGMGGRGEEFLKAAARQLQELNMPDVSFARKEATLGNSDNSHEFLTMKHEKYPDYEFWLGAIDRAGQLKTSWYVTVALPNRVTQTLINLNRGGRTEPKRERSSKRFGKFLAQKINQKISGKPTPIRVRPHEMTMDDREELGTYVTLFHQAVLAGLEEVMNSRNLDFTKVDTHTEGFLNLT